MTPSYRPYHPTQAQLFPPSPLDWLPKNHVAYFVMDVLRHLDLSVLHRQAGKSAVQGALPRHPLLMVNLLVYGTCTGVTSSRMIERKTYDDVAFRVLAGGDHPDHGSIRSFRRSHGKALTDVLTQVLAVAMKAGLVRLGTVELTGGKRTAKRRVIDIGRVREIAESLLASAAEADKNEDVRFGKKYRGDELPDDLQQPEMRAVLIPKLVAALAAEKNPKRRGKTKAAADAKGVGPAKVAH
jgi:transposase